MFPKSLQFFLLRIRSLLHILLNFLHGGRQLILNLCIDLLAKQFAGGSDNLLSRNFHLAVFVQVKGICCSLIHRCWCEWLWLLDCLHIIDDVDNLPRRTENTADVREQEIGHKPSLHNFPCVDVARNCENLLRIQLDHRAFIILAVDREEVQEFPDVLLTTVEVPLVSRRLRNQVIRKLLENRKGTSRVEIEHIGILLSVGITLCICEQARILCTESRLHIKSRARHVGEHENRRPFGNRYPGSQLSHGQRDGFVVFRNCLCHLVKGLLILIVIV